MLEHRERDLKIGADAIVNRLFVACLLMMVFGAQQPVLADGVSHLRLLDPLDRPADGYCVDVVGTPGNLRTDLPLFAHNCKPALSSDSAVVLEANGKIRFIDVDLCITVAGINSQALPGTSLLLQSCGASTPFFQTTELQTFALRNDDRLELAGTGLCVTVGSRSAATYSGADRWRALFVDECESADYARSRWTFVRP